MKTQIYHMNAEATDKNGKKHIVTIVGQFSQHKESFPVVKETEVGTPNQKKISPCILIYKEKKNVRVLQYAYSICHTDDLDDFSEDKGVEVALKRLKRGDIIGELTTTYCTTLCPDQIEMIIMAELMHVTHHIDKYINRKF